MEEWAAVDHRPSIRRTLVERKGTHGLEQGPKNRDEITEVNFERFHHGRWTDKAEDALTKFQGGPEKTC